jgi:hypothetical protein
MCGLASEARFASLGAKLVSIGRQELMAAECAANGKAPSR